MMKRKRADNSHEDQRDERATGNKKKQTEVVCMSPETGTIFTTVVNLELSDEQRANTDAEDILRETKEIFDSYSVPRTEAESASTQDAVKEDLNQYEEELRKSGRFSFRGILQGEAGRRTSQPREESIAQRLEQINVKSKGPKQA